MKYPVRTSLCALAGALLLSPMPAAAQQDDAPEVHYITVTRMSVPPGEDRQRIMEMYERVVVPQIALDPNVVSYSVATHNWGSDSKDVVIMTEYANWEGIEADCPACDEWFESNFPENSPQRAEVDELADLLGGYLADHQDEIYVVNMNRAKR